MARAHSGRSPVPALLAAVLLNGIAGLLYVWSLFILPLEASLGVDRGRLGLVPSLALIAFTIGVSVLPRLAARLGWPGTAALAVGLMAGGHLAFGLWPSWPALLAGYGIAFGTGSGLAYGLALALASGVPAALRARGIGLALAAFALSGILLPVVLGGWIAVTDPARAFLRIGLAALLPGLCCLPLLRVAAPPAAEAGAAGPVPAPDRPFFLLSAVFFALCCIGLAVVSQAAAMATAAGLAAPGRAATALTLGYLAGSLFGASIAERGRERRVLIGLAGLAGAGALALLSAAAAVFLAGAASVGLAFGGAGAILPMLIGRRYGAAHIPAVYGRMILAYGLAGLAAPWIAGLLYAAQTSYAPMLAGCLGLAVAAMAVAALLRAAPSIDVHP